MAEKECPKCAEAMYLMDFEKLPYWYCGRPDGMDAGCGHEEDAAMDVLAALDPNQARMEL